MATGILLAIHLGPRAEGPMEARSEARAVPGRGLEGDRYFLSVGTKSKKPGPDRELTLVEEEALDALARDYGVVVSAAESRRNLLTRGIALNHLVGREFRVGEVRARGIRLCEPCDHLARLTGKAVVPGLVHRGGLRAQILTEGTIRVGDPVEAASPESR